MKQDQSLQDAIVSLYLDLKLNKDGNLEEVKEKLRNTNPKIVLEYIKSSIEIFINTKLKEKLENISSKNKEIIDIEENGINEYEKYIRHLEAEIRNHIKIEHQMKLLTDSLQTKLEENEKLISELKYRIRSNKEQGNKETNTINIDVKEFELMKEEISNLKSQIKNFEEKNSKTNEFENKILLQKMKYHSQIRRIEEDYKQKIKKMRKKINTFEEIITHNEKKDNNPETDRVTHNRATSLSEKILKTDDLTGKIENYKHIIGKKIHEIHNIKRSMNDLEPVKFNNEIINSRKFDETESRTDRKGETVSDFKFMNKIKNSHHIRTNSIAGSKPLPVFNINITNMSQTKKKVIVKDDNIRIVKPPVNPGSKNDGNIINVYSSDPSRSKHKEINLKQIIQSKYKKK